MIKKTTLLLILIFPLLFSCEQKSSELKFEQAVVYEIFPALMDSLHRDFRLKPPPPPPKPIINENGEIIGRDSTGFQQALSDFKERKAELEADTVTLVIAVRDSVDLLENEEKNRLLSHFSNYDIKLDTTDLSTKYKLQINHLETNNDKVQFRYRSKFPEGSDIWEEEYDFHLSGITSISRIQFDSTKSFGVLESGMSCGKWCGIGVRVFIRKENGKWIIDEITVIEIA